MTDPDRQTDGRTEGQTEREGSADTEERGRRIKGVACVDTER